MVTSLTSLPRRLRAAFFAYLALVATAGLTGRALAAEVTASLDRTSVAAGDGATLTIEINNGEATTPQAPQVPDLIIRGGGRSQQMSFYNGEMSSTTSFRYAVGSMKPGDYTIPPFTLKVDGTEVKTQPLKLKVLPSRNHQPGSLPPGNAGTIPPGGADATPGDGSTGFLTVEMVRKDARHAWVGEIVAVKIKAWFPENAQPVALNSKVQPEGSAFTLHNLSEEPHQGVEMRNGKRFRVLTWHGGLSAAKAGTYPPDLTLKAVVAVRDRAARPQRPRSPFGRDPFDDPFFDDFFTQVVRKEIELSSKNDAQPGIEVRALPTKGKPADFSGAVGKFAFQNTVIPDNWKTGEPQQVTAEISGEGNFNLLTQPELHPAENWKTYPGQSEFAAKDFASFSGTQTFRLNAVPRKGGSSGTHLQFSYFDPDAGRYETAKSPLQKIEVTGADLKSGDETVVSTDAPKPSSSPDGLAPVHADDTTVHGLMPPAFGPSFRIVLGASGAAVLAGVALARLRSVRGDPRRIAREAAEKATRAALQEAESFAARGDVPGFFAAARRALQVQLANSWGRPAQAITLADVTSRVPADSPVVEFFQEADRLEYSRAATPAGETLTAWRARLHEAMNSLPPTVPA